MLNKNVSDIIQEQKDCLDVTVKIDYRQVLKVVVQDLIDKRNHPANEIKKEFDKVLLYYLGKEDFEKYVTNGNNLTN